MATQTIRPNALVADNSAYTRTGGTTKHGVLADDADATYLTQAWTGSLQTIKFGASSYTLAAGERVARLRGRIRARVGATPGYCRFIGQDALAGWSLFQLDVDSGSLTMAFGTVTGSWFGVNAGAAANAADQQPWIDALQAWMTSINSGAGGGQAVDIAELFIDLDVWARTSAPSVSAPSGTITDTDRPTVTWTVASLNDGVPASGYTRQVRVFTAAQYGAGGFDPATSPATWEITQTGEGAADGSVPVGVSLADDTTYRAYVRVGKPVSGQTLWSLFGFSTFTLDLVLPASPTVAVTVQQTFGRNRIEVVTGALTHNSVEQVELQRSVDGGASWVTVRGGLLTTVAASTSYTVDDYDTPRGVAVMYRARVVEALVSGATIASAWTVTAAVVHPNDGTWWLLDVDVWTRVRAGVRVITDPDYTIDEAVGVFHPPGRAGSKVVVSDAMAGVDGAWEVHARGTAEVQAVEALLTWQGRLLVKSPFGWQRYIRIVERGFVERGTPGEGWRRDWSVGWVEIDDGT